MKAIFLDIDGVLNRDCTKERFDDAGVSWTGVDIYLRDMFLNWLKDKDYKIVLSSTWRNFIPFCQELARNDISWMARTPRLDMYGMKRGHEIDAFLRENEDIKAYAILDDMNPGEFLEHQRKFLVQTSPVHGLRKKNLTKIEAILNDCD